MNTGIPELKSSNWIAQETRSQAAVGKKLEICNLQDQATWHLLCQKLMIFVEQQRSQLQHQQQRSFTIITMITITIIIDQSLYKQQHKKIIMIS